MFPEVAVVAEIGGTTVDKAIRRMMAFLVENELSRQNTLSAAMESVNSRDSSYSKLCTVCLLFMGSGLQPIFSLSKDVNHTAGPQSKAHPSWCTDVFVVLIRKTIFILKGY